MKENEHETVFIIDDEVPVRRSLSLFLTAHNFHVETFGSSDEFLHRETFEGTGCLLLDVNLIGKNGFELHEELQRLNSHLPVIFMTGRGNIRMSVKALKNGALNFLEKPFDDAELIRSINEAVELSRKLKSDKEEIRISRYLIQSLTNRESEVLTYIISGMLNKQTAAKLNIAEQTVKLHRQRICEKLGVKSIPEIIRIAEKAGVTRIG